ncbi:MAG: DNA translocase FtsK, partial [Oscillochloris sp.]|nr:DNA translocase FtsK [Oscillochloris sp.]
MASRGGNKAGGRGRRTPGKGRAPARKATRKSPNVTLSLRPEHQRELFALALITVALVTLVFFLTGVAGVAGGFYLDLVRWAFGSGALVVPATLGLLGVAILIQERIQDAKLTGANAIGTVLVLAAILGLLEFPIHMISLADRLDQGGGMLGFGLVEGLDRSIGRPAAVLVVIVLGLAGVMLTFNL